MRYFLVVGEASGDLHASNLMAELLKLDNDAEFCFLGGDLMQAVGGEMVMHYREMAFMGFVTILRNLRKVLHNFDVCKRAIHSFQPDVVILVDYPGFNLRIAKYVKQHTKIPVHYYIAPKIWAWKEHRVNEMKKYVDRIFTIFPFETAFYAKHQVAVEYVGNPSVDSVSNRPLQSQSFGTFRALNHLSSRPIIALLAGSRKQEIVKCLPRMLEAASSFTDYQVVIAGAPGIDPSFYKQFDISTKATLVFNQTYQLLQHASAAVVNSGTATLETALIGTAQVVVYHVPLGRVGNWIKNVFLKVKYVSLVNLIAEREAVVELLAHQFTVQNVVVELNKVLNDKRFRAELNADYNLIKKTLGEAGTAQRAAVLINKYTKTH
ncbi:MAG: lipid-A-disaccharide synthase [Paludibacter sp.]|nr:lipid-A-disaccharide synthase [Paludibacter sp.]